MAVFTLFGQAGAPGSAASDTSNYTMGVQFSVSQSATLTGIWFNSASGAGSLPSEIALYTAAGTLVHSEVPSWSGAAASGWVKAAFSSPPSLTSGTNYVAAVFDVGGVSGNWYSATGAYWSSGAGASGITNGPLSAPNSAGAVNGQGVFNQGGALTFPASTFNATNYWIDPEVTTSGGGTAHTATAALTVTPSFSAARTRGRFRTGALTVTPALHATATVTAPAATQKINGGWWQLLDVYKQQDEEFDWWADIAPFSCPRDGEPLRNAPPADSGSSVERYCTFCGFEYPRDWVRPQRM